MSRPILLLAGLMVPAFGGSAAAPLADRQAPSPITSISTSDIDKMSANRSLDALLKALPCGSQSIPTFTPPPSSLPQAQGSLNCVRPDDVRMIDIYRAHNAARARYGAQPLVWDQSLADGAKSYAPELRIRGLVHSPREGRATIRENLARWPRGTSGRDMARRWIAESQFFAPGVFPNVSRTGDWNAIAHYTQIIWPTTTRVGCGISTDAQWDWLVCRYSPPGNRDGVVLGLPGPAPLYCQNRDGVMMCPGPEEGKGKGGKGGNAENGGNAEGAGDNSGGAREGQDANEGGTRTRPPPVAARPDDGISRVTGDCGASVIAKVRIIELADPRNPNKRRRTKESHNLSQGFSEIVIPYGWDAAVEFKPDPDPSKTFPAPGRMDARWGIVGQPNPHTASVTGGYPKLQTGKWDTEGGLMDINPQQRPTVQQHSIFAEWDPLPATNPDKCPTGHDFTVTFAGEIPEPGALNIATFVGNARGAGFAGTRARAPANDGTRAFHEGPTTPYFRNGNVVVPIGIYWDLPDNCCDIKKASRKVIQFARAAIHGPNGRQGKGWGLDILPSELERARGRNPTHNPTYSGHPRRDGDENPTPDGAGGTSSFGSDVVQWDAPGMPKDLYDRLFAAQGASVYRQQFLSLLVCRPSGTTTAQANLASAKVCRVAITTVRWDFPGQAGIQPRPGPRRGDPPVMPYRQPVITVSFDVRDGNCGDLRAFLAANGLLEALEHPGSDARNLEILRPEPYDELDRSVTGWEANPFADVHFP